MKTFILNLLAFTLIFALTNCESDDKSPQNQIVYQEFEIDFSNHNDETIYYDIDKDSKDDLKLIRSFEKNEEGTKHFLSIIAINRNTFISSLKNKTTYELWSIDDNINNPNALWLDNLHSSHTIKTTECQHLPEFYYGFKANSPNQTNFGWFKISHNAIQELAYNKTVNLTIQIGQKE